MSRYLRHLPPLETLIVFEAVVRCGSFTRAATELFVTQSAVSKQIRTLEDSLKVALFERRPRGIELTAAGTKLYAEVSTQLEALLRTVTSLRAGRGGNTITVACTHAVAQYWLFPRLVEFSRNHPGITVNIHAGNDIGETNVAEHDFGILYGGGQWTSLTATPLFPEVVYPVCSRTLPVPEVHTVEELSQLPLIQLDASAWNCLDWRDWFHHFEFDYTPPAGATTFNQVTLALNAVLQGMGIGLGWEFMVQELVDKGELARVGPFAFTTGQADYLVHARHKSLSAAAECFRDWLVQSVAHQ
ncbi:LysR substrate-binding domain-containing protein [Crenobacter sp. SG2305]|uniref:LysR substrate-binding domain-containing protein n=1 Tax=Crenobacter oryzisoli TaxID=3056844 RepID=UPI0025AA3C31|nr:LysR substrate-binding domain-containing protein [Crenobacter sp. SG2305]MDN0085691.1 LysR substrate-binding domain-containing protein [Crenobacter sp. SG2305]